MLQVSSSATGFYINFLPIYLGFIILVGGIVEWQYYGLQWGAIVFLAILLVLLLGVLLNIRKLTQVKADEKFLYLSQAGRDVKVDLRSVKTVRQGVLGILLSPELGIIEFNQQNELGDKVYFTPPFRAINLGTHQVVEELKQLVKIAKLSTRDF